MGRVAAIDYGRARIGIALTDEGQRVALPFKTIASSKSISQAAKNVIKELAPLLPSIEKFILGLPLLMSGKKGEMAEEVEKFKLELEKLTDIPIVFWDERLTSAQAEISLKEMNLSRKKRAEHSDPVSAMIILENFLSAQKQR